MPGHRFAAVGFPVQKTPLVPFAVHPAGHLDACQSAAFGSLCKFPAKTGDLFSSLRPPFFGSQARALRVARVGFHEAGKAVRDVGRITRAVVPHVLFRVTRRPPARGIHMQTDKHSRFRANGLNARHLLFGVVEGKGALRRPELFQEHIYLVQADAVVAKLLNVVLRQFIPAAPSAGHVGQGI